MATNVVYRNKRANWTTLAETIYLCAAKGGLTAPAVQGGFILTKEEYKDIRRDLDEFYRLTSDEEIKSHNDERMRVFAGGGEQPEQEQVTKKTSQSPGHVYVIKSVNLYKIGRTGDMEKRMKSFERSLPHGFEMICSWYTTDTRTEEAEMHSILAEKRVTGEWFALGDDDVDFLSSMAIFNTQHRERLYGGTDEY